MSAAWASRLPRGGATYALWPRPRRSGASTHTSGRRSSSSRATGVQPRWEAVIPWAATTTASASAGAAPARATCRAPPSTAPRASRRRGSRDPQNTLRRWPPPDWLELCRRAAGRAAEAIEREPDRVRALDRGAGGDTTLVIDRAAEDAVFAELEELDGGLLAISEERGEVEVNGGGPLRVVIDPVDGSRNARRGMGPYALSVAVAEGPTLARRDLRLRARVRDRSGLVGAARRGRLLRRRRA